MSKGKHTSNVQAKAAEASAEVESVTNAVLIEPSEANAIVELDQADAATGSEIKKRIDEIDMTNTSPSSDLDPPPKKSCK